MGFYEKFYDTFYSSKQETTLRQDDVIDHKKLISAFDRNSLNKAKLKNIYPYFFETYQYSVVISQCCDLDNKPGRGGLKVDCIQLAALKPFIIILNEQTDKKSWYDKDKNKIKDNKIDSISKFFDAFLNHRHSHIFFYPHFLKDNTDNPFGCKLDISVSLRSECYQDIFLSKIKSISDPYRHKLGQTLGHLFSRVALTDFSEIVEFGKDDENLKTELAKWLKLLPEFKNNLSQL